MDIGELIIFGLQSGAIVGFAFGLGVAGFSWMVRQVYGMFRKVILAT